MRIVSSSSVMLPSIACNSSCARSTAAALSSRSTVPADVEQYFFELVKEGWQLCFITGRNYHFAKEALKKFTFPYHLAVINGATILEMPGEKVVASSGLDHSVFPVMNAICEDEITDFVVYGGFEQGDVCYYRPDHFTPELLDYVLKRAKTFNENWVPVPDFRVLQFSSIKCIGKKDSLLGIFLKILLKKFGIHHQPPASASL